eukprot:scaffold28845_cov123-Isochrysis_galbana.AAC.5
MKYNRESEQSINVGPTLDLSVVGRSTLPKYTPVYSWPCTHPSIPGPVPTHLFLAVQVYHSEVTEEYYEQKVEVTNTNEMSQTWGQSGKPDVYNSESEW